MAAARKARCPQSPPAGHTLGAGRRATDGATEELKDWASAPMSSREGVTQTVHLAPYTPARES